MKTLLCRLLKIHKWIPITASDEIRAEIWNARYHQRPVRLVKCGRCGLKR